MSRWFSGALVALCLALPARADDQTPVWARDAVQQLQQSGLLDGYPNGHLDGYRAMTRYELAELLNRVESVDRQAHGNLATKSELSELQRSAQSVRGSLDETGGPDLERRVEELELRLDELGRPEF